MTTRDLGVWTYENSALVLIDYQKEMFETIRSETSANLADLHVRLLARIARALDMPIVLSTVGVKLTYLVRFRKDSQPEAIVERLKAVVQSSHFSVRLENGNAGSLAGCAPSSLARIARGC